MPALAYTYKTHWHIQSNIFFLQTKFFLWDKVKGRTGCFEIGSTTDYQILFSYFERNFDIQGNTYCF